MRFLDRNTKDAQFNQTFTEDGKLSAEEMTVTVTKRREYNTAPFTKVYHNKELLKDLSPWACKILIHIALHLGWNAQRIQLSPKLTGIDKRMFSKTMVELMFRGILRKEKREYYWVNITLLLVGVVDRKELTSCVESNTNVPD